MIIYRDPIEDDEEIWLGDGMVIIRAGSLAEAREIAESDPMHSSGARTFTIRPWLMNEGTITVKINFAAGARELLQHQTQLTDVRALKRPYALWIMSPSEESRSGGSKSSGPPNLSPIEFGWIPHAVRHDRVDTIDEYA